MRDAARATEVSQTLPAARAFRAAAAAAEGLEVVSRKALGLVVPTHVDFDLPQTPMESAFPLYGTRRVLMEAGEPFVCDGGGLRLRRGHVRLHNDEASNLIGSDPSQADAWLGSLFLADGGNQDDFVFKYQGKARRQTVKTKTGFKLRKRALDCIEKGRVNSALRRKGQQGAEAAAAGIAREKGRGRAGGGRAGGGSGGGKRQKGASGGGGGGGGGRGGGSSWSSSGAAAAREPDLREAVAGSNKFFGRGQQVSDTHTLQVGSVVYDASDTTKYPNGLLNTQPRRGANTCVWGKLSGGAQHKKRQRNAPTPSPQNVFLIRPAPRGTLLTVDFGASFNTSGFVCLTCVPNTEAEAAAAAAAEAIANGTAPPEKKKRPKKKKKAAPAVPTVSNSRFGRIRRKPGQDHGCQICGGLQDEHLVLLCDRPMCNREYHMTCLSPPLEQVPEGDWFCPYCVSTGRVDGKAGEADEEGARGDGGDQQVEREEGGEEEEEEEHEQAEGEEEGGEAGEETGEEG